jgi:hypothetical protein
MNKGPPVSYPRRRLMGQPLRCHGCITKSRMARMTPGPSGGILHWTICYFF